MKRILGGFLVILMLFSLAACRSNETPTTSDSAPQGSQQNSSTPSDTNANVPDTPSQGESNILIAYFSRWGNTEYPDNFDASTSASVVIDGERFGTTEYVARMIQQTVGGDIHLIETVTPYTTDFDELRDVNHNEMANNTLPELKESDLDISKYDTVFVGYPVWATDVPQAVISFLNQYDLSDKTVIPFCTHDGYGGREYYGGVDFYPKNLEGGKKTFDNGDIIYCEAHHNMAIFYAQTDNPNLSVDVIPIGKVTSDLAVFDTLDSREDITFSLAE